MRRTLAVTVAVTVAATATLALAPAVATASAGPGGAPTATAGSGPGTGPGASPVPERVAVGDAYIVVRRDDASSTDPRTVTDATRADRERAVRAIAAAVGATPTATTSTVLSSFTARLDPAQVARLRARADVATVSPVTRRRATAVGTPAALGLTGTGAGTWASYGGAAKAGRGIVVGLVDSGIWPESPAFTAGVGAMGTAATTAVGVAYRPTATTTAMRTATGHTFRGDCSGQASWRAVQAWTPKLCNQALVSARAFPPILGWTMPGANDARGRDYASPRDGLGHGTHTASTAAGRTTSATYGGRTVSSTGVAPGAAVAAYKACWTGTADDDHDGRYDNTCTDDSLVDAVDQAVRDGVDVLNLSISGTTSDPGDPLELALLGAARAGVLVVASAGNDGPSEGSVNHPVPWVMTVGDATWSGTRRVDGVSGRGPAVAFGGAVLKPDVVAPGTDVVASVPPAPGQAASTPALASMTGSSMAAPHVAGLAAILRAAHPRWTPMMVRSALTTGARPMPGVGVWSQGAGYVDPRTAATQDLLADATPAQYLAVARFGGAPGTVSPMNPVDLGQPSIVLPDVATRHTASRRLVSTRAGAWTVSASLPGYRVRLPARHVYALRAGRAVRVSVDVTRTTAARGAWSSGEIVLRNATSTVRLPLVVRTR